MPTKKQVAKKGTKQISDAETVSNYMQKLEHPLKTELEAVRKIIKASNPKISERVKWNAPSYYYKQDIVTFAPRSPTQVHLVFHHPLIVTIQSPLLKGDYKDRRMMYFQNMQEITEQQNALQGLINHLIQLIDEQTTN